MKEQINTIQEALERAQNGLKWYRDAHPGNASQADDEMDAEIEQALTALTQLEAMAGEPVAWMANFTNRYGNPDVYVTTHKHLAVENDANGAPRPLVFGDAAPPAHTQYEAGDMAAAAAQGFRDGVASVAQQPQAEAVPSDALHTFLDAAAGEGLVLGSVDAADLYIKLFPTRYAAAQEKHGCHGGDDSTLPQQAEAVPSELVRDAARYRWLRSQWFTMGASYPDGTVQFHLGNKRWSEQPESNLDAAIDAAMAQGEKP